MNLYKLRGLLDLHIDVILEVLHEPSASTGPLVLLEAGGVDVRGYVGQLEAEVDGRDGRRPTERLSENGCIK